MQRYIRPFAGFADRYSRMLRSRDIQLCQKGLAAGIQCLKGGILHGEQTLYLGFGQQPVIVGDGGAIAVRPLTDEKIVRGLAVLPAEWRVKCFSSAARKVAASIAWPFS